MDLLPKKIRRIWKQFTTPNQILFETSKRLGFSITSIRRSLITINEINLSEVISRHNKRVQGEEQISLPTMSRAINLGRNAKAPKVEIAVKVASAVLNLPEEELFPFEEAA